jgi:hypothetical protein
MLDRSIPTREALVHSNPITEVKDMTSDVYRHERHLFPKKYFEPYLRVQF